MDCSFESPCVRAKRPFFDLAQGVDASDIQMTPWAAAIQAQRESRNHVDDPYGRCLPPGVPRISTVTPFRIIATPTVTAILYELDNGQTFRQVFTDGRSLPRVIEPTWLGYSVGTWDGDVFVVDSTGFKDGGWLDTDKGRPHSDVVACHRAVSAPQSWEHGVDDHSRRSQSLFETVDSQAGRTSNARSRSVRSFLRESTVAQ
jgi:hypothetical protein